MQKEPKSSADAGPSAGAAPEAADSALPQDSAGKHAVSVLWSFGKCLGALLPVYLAGYFGFSISVVLLGLLVYMRWKHSRDGKQARLQSAMYLLENEQDVTTTRVFRSKRELPAWVNFPDVEKVEWMNKILQQAWPFIGQYLEKLLVETIAPSIRAASAHLQTLSFTKVDLGDRVYKSISDKRLSIFKTFGLCCSYAGDVEINVEVKKYFCKAGVKGVQLHGRLRVILEPLIGDVPLVGAITMFFIRRPKLDINWTGLTNLLDIPGLNAMTDTMIMDALASFLVLPNRLTVPLVANLHVAQLRSPLPRGIVRIHLLEAENLAAKDNYMKGVISGKSDPYAVLRVGTQTFTSHHVDNNLNPQWREMYEVIVHEVPGQELELEDVPSGQVHLKLEWLSLLPSAERLNEVLERNKNITVYGKTADPPSAAVLTVYLDRAQDLPFKKGNKDPSPMVQISVQDTTKESRTVYGTNNPVWEDAFTFFIQDPSKQDIDIQVKDDDRALTLGGLSIPLSRLLSSAELSMDQWFQLEKSGPASRIYITAMLRVLWLNEEAILTTPVSPLPGEGDDESELSPGLSKLTPTSKRPEHSSPDGNFASEGVLRIHLVEAQSLVAKDNLMGGMVKGKSDPYVKIRVGGLAFKSQVIKENLNPIWNELYEVILTQLPGQEALSACLFVSKYNILHDFFFLYFLYLVVCLFTPIYACVLVQWYTLNDVKSGRLHLVLEWVPKVSDSTRLEQQSYLNKIVPSAALLFVYIERAHGLPLKKSGKEPKAGAEVLTKESCFSHKVVNRSTSPQWDEAFHFLMHNPSEDTLIVKVRNFFTALGSLVLPVRELLDEKDLVLDRWFSLDGAMPESQILLRAELKVRNHTHIQHVLSSRTHLRSARMKYIIQTALVSIKEKNLAQVKLSVAYLSEKNRLVITIHACRNLPSFSKDPPDTYISFILLPDKNRNTKRKTSVKKKSLKPEFNERLVGTFIKKHLEVSVKNSVSFMSREKELLGKLQLDLCQLDLKTGVSQWYVLYCCSL
uniref:Extended synaptotagmin 1 n=1 Tax=Sinocyclocheilus grahami TaxID=75366 RepID=A0A672LFV4_SINGR